MAFVKEKLTEEQRETFKKRKIQYEERGIFEPRFWVIDKNKNTILSYIGVTCKDDPDENIFFFEWESNCFFVKVKKSKERPTENQLILTWSEFEINCLTDKTFNLEQLKTDFKVALKKYGLFGNPDPKFQLPNNTIYNFEF